MSVPSARSRKSPRAGSRRACRRIHTPSRTTISPRTSDRRRSARSPPSVDPAAGLRSRRRPARDRQQHPSRQQGGEDAVNPAQTTVAAAWMTLADAWATLRSSCPRVSTRGRSSPPEDDPERQHTHQRDEYAPLQGRVSMLRRLGDTRPSDRHHEYQRQARTSRTSSPAAGGPTLPTS